MKYTFFNLSLIILSAIYIFLTPAILLSWSETSLVQTIGRAARNAEGTVIMYADSVTRSMELAITETLRRREIQQRYNAEHGIIPKTIIKDIRDVLEITRKEARGKKGKKDVTRTSNSPARRSRIISMRSIVSTSWCIYRFW